MNRLLLLKIHRWISLVFALPLLAIIATGLVLSFEPMIQAGSAGTTRIDADQLAAIVRQADPQGKARGFSIDAAAQRLRFMGPDPAQIDLATGAATSSRNARSDFFLWARRTHERLIGQEWLVIGSTIAMIVIMTLGMLMGLPKLRNTLSGWHKAIAWFTLPLILISPVTGLFMAFGLTFHSALPAPSSQTPQVQRSLALPDAIGVIARTHDLSNLVQLANRGGRLMARMMENGELRAYAVTPAGLRPLERNWPRLIHEGNWNAMLSGPLNVLTSLALLGLLGTGVVIWTRRRLRPRTGRSAIAAVPVKA